MLATMNWIFLQDQHVIVTVLKHCQSAIIIIKKEEFIYKCYRLPCASKTVMIRTANFLVEHNVDVLHN